MYLDHPPTVNNAFQNEANVTVIYGKCLVVPQAASKHTPLLCRYAVGVVQHLPCELLPQPPRVRGVQVDRATTVRHSILSCSHHNAPSSFCGDGLRRRLMGWSLLLVSVRRNRKPCVAIGRNTQYRLVENNSSNNKNSHWRQFYASKATYQSAKQQHTRFIQSPVTMIGRTGELPGEIQLSLQTHTWRGHQSKHTWRNSRTDRGSSGPLGGESLCAAAGCIPVPKTSRSARVWCGRPAMHHETGRKMDRSPALPVAVRREGL